MRAYGRQHDAKGKPIPGTWAISQTDAQGSNDLFYVTAIAQYLALNWGESPFFGSAGIPAEESVQQQVAPDYAVSLAQQFFAPYFASLIITRQPDPVTPIYNVNILTHQGVQLNPNVPIPA
jgi:hypothetical protein